MLKLLRTLPKVLKYLPSDKAKDARNFMMSFQVKCYYYVCYSHEIKVCTELSRAPSV